MKNKKPSWVPDEVWDEYLKSAAYLAHVKTIGGDEWREREADIFGKIIANKQCGGVWKVVYQRQLDASIDARDPMRSAPYYPLLYVAVKALQGPPSDAFMASSERKNRGKEIAQLAKKLSKALLHLGKRPPAEVAGPLGDRLHRVYESHSSPQDIYGEAIWSSDAFGRLKAGIVAHDLFFRDATNILSTLEEAAKSWAKTKPNAYHVSDQGRIKRDYFIRKMTDYFQDNFGSPQRRLVMELTQCLMSESVTERDVTRIAPVKNASAPSRQKSTRSRTARNLGKN